MNAINRFELYVLEDGEKPVDVTEDTKIPNAATIKIAKQDHTVANLLRAQLLEMPEVLFAGYWVPHPLQPYVHLKIQTNGSVTPSVALEQAATKLIGSLATLETKFKREFTFKEGTERAADRTDAYGGTATEGTGAWGGRDYLDF